MKRHIVLAASIAALCATQAPAAQFSFNFASTFAFFGPDQNGSGIFTTSDTVTQVEGRNGFAITGISGQINNVAISGLTSSATSLIPTYYYFADSLTFLDGTGVHFDAGDFRDIRFFAPSATPGTYRVVGNGTIFATVDASSRALAAVPEPATWAMMIGGFGATGFAMRRSTHKSLRTLHAG